MNVSFETLPQAVNRLDERLQNIERLLLAKNSESESDHLLTIEEAAKFLKVAVTTIYDYVHRREIPHSKIRKRLYFSKAALVEWINTSGRVKTNAEVNSSAEEFLTKPKRRK